MFCIALVVLCLFVRPEAGSPLGYQITIETLEGFIVDPDKVGFYLYTSENPTNSIRIYLDEIENLMKAGFKPSYQTKFIVHGFLDNLNAEIIQDIKNNLFQEGIEANVIGVDWSAYSSWYSWYINVQDRTNAVGALIGGFIQYLNSSAGVALEDIHCIGHSLGAHACGFAGSSVTSGKIARISGLDPALPGFTVGDPAVCLDATDAAFVDCIHTDGGWFGIKAPICHADFYPNGGQDQPGCYSILDVGMCNHGRSYKFYAESILKGHLFPALSCDSLDFSPDNCADRGALMGYPASPIFSGTFYTETNKSFPFAKNWTSTICK